MKQSILKKILFSIGISALYLGLAGFYYHIDKYLPGIFVAVCTMLIPISFIFMIVSIPIAIVKIIRNHKNFSFWFVVPSLIYLLALLGPFAFDSENFENKVILRGCYDGTQCRSTIKFRDDHTFEIHSTGIFFSSFWYLGKWKKIDDTFFLNFTTKRMKLLSDTLIIRNDSLVNISNYYDTPSRHFSGFCLGYCQK
jgi:hypothetical protein